MNKPITLGLMLVAIAAMGITGVITASVNADINNPKGDIKFQNTKTVVINLKNGKDGKDGRDGADGQNGANGRDGTDGKNGTDGAPGQSGADGKNGTDGRDGQNGAPGSNGTDGAAGRDGTNGANGTNGVDGRDGQMVLVLNVSNGQHIVCSGDADGNIGCVDTSDNGTVIIPPVTNGTITNDTIPVTPPIPPVTNETIPPVTNETNGNVTAICTPPQISVNGQCITLIPIDNGTTPPVPVDNNTDGNETNNNDNNTGPVEDINGTE